MTDDRRFAEQVAVAAELKSVLQNTATFMTAARLLAKKEEILPVAVITACWLAIEQRGPCGLEAVRDVIDQVERAAVFRSKRP